MTAHRRLVPALLAAALLAPAGADAAAPAAQVAQLRDGGAILRADGRAAKQRLARRARALRLRGTVYRRLPFVAVRGERATLARLARRRGVRSAHRDRRIDFDLNESTPLVYGGAQVLADMRAAGYDGSGVNVAIVDGGVNGIHPDLQQRMVANVKVLDPGLVGAPVYVECPSATPCSSDQTAAHGTHVAGIAAGDGTFSDGFYSGVAPGAGVVGLGVGEAVTISYALAAFDWLLAHPELNVAAVNNSWGVSQSNGDNRHERLDPVNVATRKLFEAGSNVVFSAGNTGTGGRTEPAGASECETDPPASGDGPRTVGDGICRFSVYGSAPWAIAVAMGRKDGEHINYSSSRGDPVEQLSIDGFPTTYQPSLTAPGVNVRSAMSPGAASLAACGSAEPPACASSPRPQSDALYIPLSGTSMAAPQVTGAIAVVQQAAERRFGRRLPPEVVTQVLAESARPMTSTDGMWDWPCGDDIGLFIECGNGGPDSNFPDTTGRPYERWQVGAGHLDVTAAVRRVETMPAGAALKRRRR